MSILSVFPIGTGDGGSGGGSSLKQLYSLNSVKDITASANTESISLTWKDPDDILLGETKVAEWAGTKVVYKQSHQAPITPEDGILAINSTEKNSYAVQPLVISGLKSETVYSYNFFPYTNLNVVATGHTDGFQIETASTISTTLDENSWATISMVSGQNKGANYWKVGDAKTITINGTVGNTTFSNLSIDVFIIGFNHNASLEGNNKIHFQIGRINGKDVTLVDSAYSTAISTSGYFSMNTANTNIGGWENSYMRKTLLGNSKTPTAPLTGSVMSALPSDLRNVIKPCVKYTDNSGNKSNAPANVTSTTDYLYLLSEFESHGVRAVANISESSHQAQYDYYKTGNGFRKHRHNSNDSTAFEWLRSPHYNYTNGFCTLYAQSGTMSYADHSFGISPAFCV